MKDNKRVIPESIGSNGDDVTTWVLPEGAIARLGCGTVRYMTFSPDGKYFAVASAIGLWLYELPTLSPIALWDTDRGLTSNVTFSSDSRRIVTNTFAEELKVWNIQSGTFSTRIEIPNKREWCAPTFSQDGRHITVVSHEREGRIYVFCPNTGTQVSEIELGETHGIFPFLFSHNTRLLAGRKRETDSAPESIVVWNVETGEQISSFTDYTGKIEKLSFSLTGKYLTGGSSDGTIHVWDVENVELVKTYSDYNEAQIFPHYVPEDGLIVAAVSDHKVEVWDIEQNEKLDEFKHRGNGRYACFSKDGKQLAVASRSEITMWKKGNNPETHKVSTLLGHIHTMDTLVFSENDKTLAAGFWRDNVLLWDVESRHSHRPENEKLPGSSHNVYPTPNGEIISINQNGDNLNVSKVVKNKLVTVLTGLKGGFGRAKTVSPTGQRIASVDKDDNIHIWERLSSNDMTGIESWSKCPAVIKDEDFIYGLRFSPSGLAFSPDGKRLVSISRSREWRVGLWDVNSGKQIAELPVTLPRPRGYRASDTGIAFSPEGNIIAGGVWNEILLWDAKNGKIIRNIPFSDEYQRPITLCFSPCGRYLASGSWWRPGLQKVSIRLIEVASGKNIVTFWGHTTDVQCFAFTQDSTLLASGGHDGAIYLWDLKPYL